MGKLRRLQSIYLLAVLFLLAAMLPSAAEAYDPLKVEEHAKGKTSDLTVRDTVRDREIPLRVYLPTSQGPAPVILFSHGLGGSREGGAYLGRHWAARGYVGVFLQHAGSDTGVWRDQPRAKRMKSLQQAASGENYLLRVRDVPAVLDQLAKWNDKSGHPLHERLDLKRVGMSGHSFGAVTTQVVSGQAARMIGQRFTDQRISAAIAFSPSAPRRGDPSVAFGSVKIPWMLMTGTKDEAVIGDADVASRLNVYPHLPDQIHKYELVLHDGQHSAFSDRSLLGDKLQRNPNHHRVILALSTAFWDCHLRSDPAACEWLHGENARSVLEPKDRWQLQVPK